MANCQNLCTAEKCQELERRIEELENIISNHLALPIPEAHEFNLDISDNNDLDTNVYLSLADNTLTVRVGDNSDSVFLPYVEQNEFNRLKQDFDSHLTKGIPTAHEYNPSVKVDLTNVEDKTVIRVFVDDSSDNAELTLPNQKTDVLVDVFPLENGNAVIKVMVNGNSDQDYIYFPEPTIDVQNELKFTSVNDFGSKLTSTVTVNGKEATDSVTIDVNSDVELSGSRYGNGFNLTVRVDDGEDSIFIPDYVGSGGGGEEIDTSQFATKSEVAIVDGKIEGHMNTGLSDSHPNDLDLGVELDYEGDNLRVGINIEGLLSNSGTIDLSGFLGEDIDLEAIERILINTNRIYKILGGDLWGNSESEDISLKMKPEEYLRTMGKAQYQTDVAEGKELTITSIVQLIGAIASVDYFRSGNHRLPATLFESLINTEEGNQELIIYDQLSFQEWIIKQIDAISGEYPLEIAYKITDENGKEKEQTITFANNAEALAEITALIIAVSQDSDHNLNATLRALTEARAAANAATVAVDYAAANAEYLGYKGREKTKEVPVSFTPGAKTITDTLQPSKQNIIGWENQDKETLVELLKRILIGSEIIKAANFIPWRPGQKLTGDTIREKRQEKRDKDNQEWQEFITRTNNPTGRYKTNKPTAKVKDISINKPEPE